MLGAGPLGSFPLGARRSEGAAVVDPNLLTMTFAIDVAVNLAGATGVLLTSTFAMALDLQSAFTSLLTSDPGQASPERRMVRSAENRSMTR